MRREAHIDKDSSQDDFWVSLLDTHFKGPFGIKFGLDAILGLFPVVGDLVTSLMSLRLIFVAWQRGVSKVVISMMLLNVFVDFLLGSIPVVGNIFDLFWKSNTKNLKLLRKASNDPVKAKIQSKVKLLLAALFVFLIAISLFCVAYWVVTSLLNYAFNP